MNAARRIIDANANRAREAARVLEDIARFALDDDVLTRELKSLRHALVAAIRELGVLDASRDTAGDVGTTISTPAEQSRRDLADVAGAAGARLSEALRTIEEVAKTMRPDVAARIEALRYQAYDLTPRVTRGVRPPAPQWRVAVLLTESLCRHAWRDVARAAIDGGAGCVQLREQSLDGAALLERTRWLLELAADRAAIIVNDRLDVALAAGAHGVHLGQHDLPCRAARRLAPPGFHIGISTRTVAHATAARNDGADYCGVGPMFPTETKPLPEIVGPAAIERYRAACPLPHLAIGGITPDTAPSVVAAGAAGLAVSGCVCGAADPADVVHRLDAIVRSGAPESEFSSPA